MPHGGMQLVFSMWAQDSDGPMHAMDTRHERQLSKTMYPIHLPTLAAFSWHPVLFPGRPISWYPPSGMSPTQWFNMRSHATAGHYIGSQHPRYI